MPFRPAIVDCDIMTFGITNVPQAFCEGRDEQTEILWRRLMKEAHNGFRHPLRACHQRPCERATQQWDELSASHSITSSARASSVGGTSRPSALAVLRLIAR